MLKRLGNTQGELRYSPATDYICYNGICWEESKHGAQAVAQRLTANQLEETTSAAEDAWAVLTKNGAAEVLAAMSKKKAETMLTKNQTAAYVKYKAGPTASPPSGIRWPVYWGPTAATYPQTL